MGQIGRPLVTVQYKVTGEECHSLEECTVRSPKYEGRTESHEQLFFACELGQQTKESAVVDGTSCCVILVL